MRAQGGPTIVLWPSCASPCAGSQIERCDLDGANLETVILAGGTATDFAVLPDPTPPEPQFSRGDCNDDATFNIADMAFLLANPFSSGADGPCADACDANDDGQLNIADAIAGLGALFGATVPLPEGSRRSTCRGRGGSRRGAGRGSGLPRTPGTARTRSVPSRRDSPG